MNGILNFLILIIAINAIVKLVLLLQIIWLTIINNTRGKILNLTFRALYLLKDLILFFEGGGKSDILA